MAKCRYSNENTVGEFPVLLPAVDVSAIGAGGGSVAWLDAEGVLKVGPRSAGALPGPACYGRGGIEPTVTDAYAVLGIMSPDGLLGGEMKLDIEKGRAALKTIGDKLRLTPEQTADAILQVATANIYAELVPQFGAPRRRCREFSIARLRRRRSDACLHAGARTQCAACPRAADAGSALRPGMSRRGSARRFRAEPLAGR